MTDNEIIKALEDMLKNFDGEVVEFMAISSALDLINRLQAEIERLREKNTRLFAENVSITHSSKKIEAEAIKEYKEKLIFEIMNTPTKYQESGLLYSSGVANRQNEIIDIINGLDEKEIKGE